MSRKTEYEVTIHENLKKKVTIDASSREEAEDKVRQLWKAGFYILDSESFTGVDFSARKAPERSRDYER